MRLMCGLALALAAAPAAAQQMRFTPAFPGAPFSSAVQVGDILYLSGQIGTGADNKLVEGFEAQSRQAMDNIAATLKAHGLTMDAVFKCTVMIDDMAKWGDFNKVYVAYFKPGRLPARSAIGADGLAMGAAVEIECLARAKGG
jgi:2-iminobutanoate/2-iminopropanoate deaminase